MPDTHRRRFLKLATLTSASTLLPSLALPAQTAPPTTATTPRFPTSDARWQRTWDAALAVLAGNLHSMPRYEPPTLVEGAVYPGIWMECAPQEGLVYGTLSPFITPVSPETAPLRIARNNHMAFFAQQKPDGQLPASIKLADAVGTTAGYGQIQIRPHRRHRLGAIAAHQRRRTPRHCLHRL